MKNYIYSFWINSPADSFDKLKTINYQKKRTMNFSDYTYIFFLSTGRVGTKTIASLLSISGSYDVYHEPRPLLYNLSKISYETPITTHSIKLVNEAFLISRKKFINWALIKKKGYIETSPQVTFLAPFLAESFPNSKFIHLIRNPYDVVRSGMRRKWFSGHPADETRISPLDGNKYYKLWPQMTPFEKNIWLWQETNSWISNFLSHLPDSRKLFVRSEEIFSYNKEEIYKIFSFISTSCPSENKMKKVIKKKINEQQTGEFPKVNDWPQEMKLKMIEIAGKTAENLGYKLFE